LVVVILVQGKFSQVNEIVSNHKALTFIVLSGVAGVVFWLFYFLALKRGTVCQVTLIDRLSIVYAILIALVFLGEKVTWLQSIDIVVAIIVSMMVALG